MYGISDCEAGFSVAVGAARLARLRCQKLDLDLMHLL